MFIIFINNVLKKGLGILAISGLVLAGCGGGSDEGATPNNNGDVTITFGETPWSSTVPGTYVAKQLIEEMGYKVEVKPAEVGVVFSGLSTGDLDVFMDGWFPMHKPYMEKYANEIEDTALIYPDGEMGWVIPSYVEEINSLEDLKGNEDLFDGKVYGIDEGAELTATSRAMIEGYGLNLEYMTSSEAAMLAQATRQINAEEPVLFLGWRPHTMFTDFDLKILEDPKNHLETSEVRVITHVGLAEKAPDVYAMLSNWTMSVDDVEAVMQQLDEGLTPEEAASQWIEENEDKVRKILEG